MKKTKLILMSIAVVLIPVLSSATNIVDLVEDQDGWARTNDQGWFIGGAGGLAPQGGSWFFMEGWGGNKVQGTFKLFPDTYVAEQLSVTYSIGDPNNYDWTGDVNAYLFADTDNSGTFQWGEHIETSATQNRPVPADGTWAVWTDTYSIDGSTLTQAGTSVLGENIGFVVLSHLTWDTGAGINEGYSFDNLTIETVAVPEPAMVSMITACAALMLILRRRRRM